MDYVLGIDLGTTFTAAAVNEPGAAPRMLSLGSNSYAVPSVVFLREDGSFLVGEPAELQSSSDATRVARHFKRRLGDDIPIRLAATAFDAGELATEMLASVLGVATERMGEPPRVVVLTHPANWGDFRVDVLRLAATRAGIAEPVMVSEPEAAAIHYVRSERLGEGELLGVYDLGGGTFDAVMMRRRSTGFEVVGRPVGLEQLGGVDFDEAIRAFVLEAVDLGEIEPSEESMAAAYALQDACVDAKRVLSADTVAQIRVAFPGVSQAVRINRAEFERRIRPRLEETLDAFDSAVSSAGLSIGDLSRILLVGGSSRIPLVAALLAQRFGRPLAVDTDPKNTVALGAAVYGTASTVERAAPSVTTEESEPAPSLAEELTLEGRPPMAPMPSAEPPVPQAEPVPAQPAPAESFDLPSTESVSTRRSLAGAGDDQQLQNPVAPQTNDQSELLGVAAESGHRVRIPQPVAPPNLGEPRNEASEVEAVRRDPRLLLVAGGTVLIIVALVAFFVFSG